MGIFCYIVSMGKKHIDEASNTRPPKPVYAVCPCGKKYLITWARDLPSWCDKCCVKRKVPRTEQNPAQAAQSENSGPVCCSAK